LSKLLSIDPAVLQRLQRLPKNERVECLLALCELHEVFGRPHLHTGLGIRKLGKSLFECRGTIALRFIFQDRPSELFVSSLGNHDEIRRLLRTAKYGK
jgi:hypothetical protein